MLFQIFFKNKLVSKTNIYIKDERKQLTDTIMARGAWNVLSKLTSEKNGIIAISSKLTYALCYYANKLEILISVVFVNSSAEEIQKYNTINPNAIIYKSQNMIQAHKLALNIAKEKGLTYIGYVFKF